ncbi:hypothetical protein ACFQ0M_41740 [Kitasatospora aburaviensis]
MTEPGTTGPGTSAAHARGSRELVLGRIRAALYGPAAPTARAGDGRATAPAGPPVPRDYLRSHVPADDPAALLDLLHRNLADYRALVHRCTPRTCPRRSPGCSTPAAPARWPSRPTCRPAGSPPSGAPSRCRTTARSPPPAWTPSTAC